MDNIIKPLDMLEAFESGKRDLNKGMTPVYFTGVVDAAKPHMIHALSGEHQKLIITYNDLKAKALVEDMRFFDKDNVFLYPARDMIFFSADVHSNDLLRERLEVIDRLIHDEPVTVVMSIEALLDSILTKDILKASVIDLNMSSKVVIKTFSKQLLDIGFERVHQVESRGQFAIRGGIIDIYPINADEIYRIDLWGDDIDAMRLVNPETQRGMYDVDQVRILPAREMVITDMHIKRASESLEKDHKSFSGKLNKSHASEEVLERLNLHAGSLIDKVKHQGNFNGIEGLIHYYYDESDIVSILNYFEDPYVYLDEPARIQQRLVNIQTEFEESMHNRLEKGYLLPKQTRIFHDSSKMIHKLGQQKTVLLSTLYQQENLLPYQSRHDLMTKSVNTVHQNFDLWLKDLKYYVDQDYKMLFLTGSRTRAKRLVDELLDHDVQAYYVEDGSVELAPGKIGVGYGSLHKGFEYPQIKLIVLAETETMGKSKKKKKRRKYKKGRPIDSFTELKVGDYVVHENYGVGVFAGIENIEVENIKKDFIKISYKDSGNLYITTNQLDMIQKYIGAEGKAPKINKLNGTEWKKAKSRVKAAVEDLAEELIALYAKREVTKGHAYAADSQWQREFEELFPYDETDDQLQAIQETKEDMESQKIMDRLICGDVGYGKTEVAIRAAFKAVQDDKQVAYLVPTTILAQQQYNNFVQRMKDFPVRVEMLSRFKTPKEQAQIVKDISRGLVDIVIGTHRLLSKDISYKQLGLLIVDEEQRFGVKHKETLKQIKENVDVLTLTATPIPRTLHMSLIGIRSMSILEEPPQERHPVQTYVLDYNEELVKDAVYRELGRGGQVYYVFNRVKGIDTITNRLRKLIPEARVDFAHGQMSERELENIMLDFVNGDIDVLVSTTIIETGLDIPNANTIIIHDADHMGLSQLYQLRGRVGRSNRIAYAYLMYKKNKVLDEVATKRLQAIREFTEFGAGFKIAMRDLEIRGAGNILGTRQHGNMDSVGYDLYCKMLEQAINRISDKPVEKTTDVSIDVNIDAYIPSNYIQDEVRKIESYKKIATIRNDEDYQDMMDELIDRYGDPKQTVVNLLDIALIKAMAGRAHIVDIKQKGYKYLVEVKSDAPINPNKIPELMDNYNKRLKFTVHERPYFTYEIDMTKKGRELEQLKQLVEDIKLLEG